MLLYGGPSLAARPSRPCIFGASRPSNRFRATSETVGGTHARDAHATECNTFDGLEDELPRSPLVCGSGIYLISFAKGSFFTFMNGFSEKPKSFSIAMRSFSFCPV